jgi:hypothetical protein
MMKDLSFQNFLQMKSKIFLLISTFIVLSLVSKAGVSNPCDHDPGKKEDIGGNVLNGENRKPLKDVSVTAYLSSKKEKVVITDGCGGYGFEDLKPGIYKFVFEKEGFRKVVKEKIVVKVDEAFQLDIEMIQDNNTDVMPSPLHFLHN